MKFLVAVPPSPDDPDPAWSDPAEIEAADLAQAEKVCVVRGKGERVLGQKLSDELAVGLAAALMAMAGVGSGLPAEEFGPDDGEMVCPGAADAVHGLRERTGRLEAKVAELEANVRWAAAIAMGCIALTIVRELVR